MNRYFLKCLITTKVQTHRFEFSLFVYKYIITNNQNHIVATTVTLYTTALDLDTI